MVNRLWSPSRVDARRRWAGAACAVAVSTLLAGCRLVSPPADAHAVTEQDVAAAAGWTRIATTASYFVVANVLPGEQMFTRAQADDQHPIEGELIVSGLGNPLGVNVRHVEAHIYDRITGLPLSDITPSIEILNRTTGERIEVAPALMQDVTLGKPDLHYGNNVIVEGGSDLTLTVTIGHEAVTLDGHLD